MEELLNDIISPEDLECIEKRFAFEVENDGGANLETKFQYAYALVRSRYQNDIRKGITIFEDLARVQPECKRDYVYYLAFGNARIKNYSECLKYCKAFLEIEPNDQVSALEEYIKKQNEREMAKGMAVAGGAALVLGGILGVAYSLAKNKRRK